MVVPRLWKLVMIAALGAIGCTKKTGDARGADDGKPVGPPIAVAFAVTPTTADEVRIAITTEPNVELYGSVERGTLVPLRQRADTSGHASVWVRGTPGANTLNVVASIDKRESKHVFPFTVTTVEKVAFSDATPRREGGLLVGCDGFVQDRGKQDLRLCASALGLADDGSVGVTATAASLVKLTIGGQVFEAKGGSLVARIELTPAIAALELMFVDKDRPLELPASLELTTGTLIGTLELDHVPIEALFAKLAHGPVLFPGEVPAPGRSTLLLINEGKWQYAGASVPLGQVDLVAIDSSSLRKAPDCHYVATDGSGKEKSLSRMMRDHTVVVYERRTGKQLGKRRWTARTPTCEHWIKSSTPGSFAEVAASEVVAWTETFVAK